MARVKNRKKGFERFEAPYSISFRCMNSVVFIEKEEEKPIVLRGQLALKTHRRVSMPLVFLKFEGKSKFGRSQSGSSKASKISHY